MTLVVTGCVVLHGSGHLLIKSENMDVFTKRHMEVLAASPEPYNTTHPATVSPDTIYLNDHQ